MGPLTTLEDSKPDTCIILVNTYCKLLRDPAKYGKKAFLIERSKGSEMWSMDKDSLNAFVDDLKDGAGLPKPTN